MQKNFPISRVLAHYLPTHCKYTYKMATRWIYTHPFKVVSSPHVLKRRRAEVLESETACKSLSVREASEHLR